MKKVILGCLCFVFVATMSFAADVGITEYSIYFRNDTGNLADYLIPVTTVRPEVDKLTGFDCKTLAITGTLPGNPETWISIFDSTDSLMTGECFGEFEANALESIHDRWPGGRKIFNGVSMRVGAKTETILHFRRK